MNIDQPVKCSLVVDVFRGAESTRVRKRAFGEIFWIWGIF
jgi:hypothetical protein